jgi:hypothetical protein
MNSFARLLAGLAMLAATAAAARAEEASPYRAWTNGLSRDPGYFPIAVWLQDPKNAGRFKEVGINLFVGLWEGPTAGQLAELKKAGMPVICEQNRTALADPNRDIIVGWMHGDEPDNAQELPGGKGYGPPIPPARIVADYEKIRAADPTRPVMLNLGQGVAWDGWYGRGVRSNKPEDYPEYAQGGDIVSFDIYPANHDAPAVARNLWYVPKGVDRLRAAAGPGKIVWNCIECTPIGGPDRQPAPRDVRTEVWMSLIHGSQGLIYFVHVFKPRFIEAGLLADAAMAKEVTAINRQIRELAPVLNRPTQPGAVQVTSSVAEVPIDAMAKSLDGARYVFAVSMRGAPAKASFRLADPAGARQAEVLGERRTLDVKDGTFEDAFDGYAVHLYKIPDLRPTPGSKSEARPSNPAS